MNKQTLDRLRFIIPGIMISVTLYFLMHGIPTSEKPFTEYRYQYYLLSLFFSVLYYSFNIRDFIWRKIEKKFFMQYISICFESIKNDQSPPIPCVSYLWQLKINDNDEVFKKNKYLFFNFIDTNIVLKEKSQQIMLNGCILTSILDLALICCFVVLIEVVLYFIKYGFDKAILILCTVLIVLTPVVIWRLIKQHLKLIRNQMYSVEKEWFYEKKD